MTLRSHVDDLFDRKPWPNQEHAVKAGIHAVQRSEHTCITSPTGSGKTAIMIALIRWCAATGRRAILYTNRVMLTEQTIRSLHEHNVDFGVIANTEPGREDRHKSVQLAMIQTVNSRALKKKSEDIWRADCVIVDECHQMATGSFEKVIREHIKVDGTAIGITATPIGVSHIYPNLYIAGRTQECMEYGALVPALYKAPWEMDTTKLKVMASGEFSLPQIRKHSWNHALFGLVYDSWVEHNPEARPTLGFAPGVQESKWFCDEFTRRGVRTAHIDGDDVRIDNVDYKSDREARNQIVQEWKAGEIKAIWNRFVLREGIDFPWMYHLILACPIGTLAGYIQTCGRVLRYSPETPDYVLISDHAGNYYRHGHSPNKNIDWREYYDAEPTIPTRQQRDLLSEDPEREPRVCPKCSRVLTGRQCPPPPFGCGHYLQGRIRKVVQHNGKLRDVSTPAIKRKRIAETSHTYRLWRDMFFRFRQADRSVAQAKAFFFHEYHYYPPADMPYMTHKEGDSYRKIRDVPIERFISVEDHREIRNVRGQEPSV